jgi:GTPase SAR1 family protein
LKTVILESNHHNTSSTDINILLLGETFVGKTTFINALVNYLVHDTLDAALQGNIQVLVPFVYHFTDPNTYESFEIKGGTTNENEWCHNYRVSWTQICQTYNFTIGNRLLRIIDTPPINDTRGPFQDIKNMSHIFTYISKYKHLNSVCMLWRPNENHGGHSKLEYCIKEFLTHLHINTQQNITWVFTHARSTFYLPGATMPILKSLLSDISSVDLRITPENCFLFDNETLRILALNKDHSEFVHSHLSDFRKSWNKSTATFGDLVSFLLSCKPLVIRETFFLNIARQLTHRLIGLINDKISPSLCITTVNDVSASWNLEKASIRNVCVTLSEFIKLNSILPFNDRFFVRRKCFIYHQRMERGVGNTYTQCLKKHSTTTFADDTMKDINALFSENLLRQMKGMTISRFLKENSITSFSNYLEKYISNSFKTKLNEQTSNAQFLQYVTENSDFSSSDQAKKYLCSIFYEEFIKQTTSVEYLQYLQENSMVPLNHNMIEFVCQLIFEQIDWNSNDFDSNDFDSKNTRSMDNLISDYHELEKLLTININEQAALFDINTTDQTSQMNDILKLLDELCALPINGKYIRQYMKDVEKAQRDMTGQGENIVILPKRAQSSALMLRLRAILEQN